MRHPSFTLIELLLVIGIIATLASIVILAINPQRMLGQARDAQRRNTVNQLEKALNQYLIDNSTFPPGMIEGAANAKEVCRPEAPTGSPCVNLNALVPTYLPSLAVDPAETNVLLTGYVVAVENGRPRASSLHLGGGSREAPASSCLAILQRGGSFGDGLYWLDPDGAGGSSAPFQAYCDMTTDGGGWTRGMTFIAGDTSTCNTAARWSTILTITTGWPAGGSVMSKWFNVGQVSPFAAPASVVKFTPGPYGTIRNMFSFPGTDDGWDYVDGSFNLQIISGTVYANTIMWDWGGTLQRKANYCIGPSPDHHHACIFQGSDHGLCGYLFHDTTSWTGSNAAQELYVREN